MSLGSLPNDNSPSTLYCHARSRELPREGAWRDQPFVLRERPLAGRFVDGALLRTFGAGIGALTFELLDDLELLDAGATRAICRCVAGLHCGGNARSRARPAAVWTRFILVHDDFLAAVRPGYLRVPFVTLNRVICCYPASVHASRGGTPARGAALRTVWSYPRYVLARTSLECCLERQAPADRKLDPDVHTFRRAHGARRHGSGISPCQPWRVTWTWSVRRLREIDVTAEIVGKSDIGRGDTLIPQWPPSKSLSALRGPLRLHVCGFVPGCEHPVSDARDDGARLARLRPSSCESAIRRLNSPCRAPTARSTASQSYQGKQAVVLAWFVKAFTGP